MTADGGDGNTDATAVAVIPHLGQPDLGSHRGKQQPHQPRVTQHLRGRRASPFQRGEEPLVRQVMHIWARLRDVRAPAAGDEQAPCRVAPARGVVRDLVGEPPAETVPVKRVRPSEITRQRIAAVPDEIVPGREGNLTDPAAMTRQPHRHHLDVLGDAVTPGAEQLRVPAGIGEANQRHAGSDGRLPEQRHPLVTASRHRLTT
jgi:hypothetical protein